MHILEGWEPRYARVGAGCYAKADAKADDSDKEAVAYLATGAEASPFFSKEL